MFGEMLFARDPTVLSEGGKDLAKQFIYWRGFTAEQLRQGRLPLWNPHVFCGMPHLGLGQTEVLYPSNWLDAVLPLARSINLGIALHVFLAGLFAYFWGVRRGLHPIAAVVAGTLFMFSGSYFLHVYAGHLSVLYAIAWTPLVFASVDEWTRTRMWRWVVVGMAAIAMQILAGDFQACFYTGVAAASLALFGLIGCRHRLTVLLGVSAMYVGAVALGAVQLLTTSQVASESIRAGGVTYEYASTVSFAPQNLLTLLVPGFFGNETELPYWGRWIWWEMCLFIGVSGLVLAAYGAVCGKREVRRSLVPLLAIMLVLALGANTPLFKLLYRWVPGFNRFRGNSKFIIEAALFLVMLAGAGLDRLLHDPKGSKWLALGVFLLGVVVGIAAWRLHAAAVAPVPSLWWSRTIRAVNATYESPSFVKEAGVFASRGLFIAAVKLLAFSALLVLVGTARRMAYLVALVAVAEIFVFARSTIATFDLASTEASHLEAFLDKNRGDYRIFYPPDPNIAIRLGTQDVWGYAPLINKRYAEFMAFTQGERVEPVDQDIHLRRFTRVHAMLRLRRVFSRDGYAGRDLTGNAPMDRLQLVQQYQVISERDEILRTLDSPSFNPRERVILETEPNPAPQPSAEKGTVTLLDSSANQLTVEADLPHPAILLITDAYSNGWRARPLAGSVQRAYEVLPANYVLRAIPLTAGHHHIRIEYAPIGFRLGAWVSVVSLLGFMMAIVFCAVRNHISRTSAGCSVRG